MADGTVNVLGTRVSATNLADAVARINGWIAGKNRTYVCVTGVHGIMESERDPELRAVHNQAGMATPDGMPLVYLARLAGFRGAGRVYGPDLMEEICKQSVALGHRHFFYGTTPETLSKLTDRLRQRYPGLQVAGSYSPPFRPLNPGESADIAARINGAEPDIVWVGLSTPKQEFWMARHRALLNAPVLIGVGAAFDFHAGTLRQSPRWMRPLCLEWLFRLAVEPRRLWKRYLLNNPRFLAGLVLQSLGLKKYEADAMPLRLPGLENDL